MFGRKMNEDQEPKKEVFEEDDESEWE